MSDWPRFDKELLLIFSSSFWKLLCESFFKWRDFFKKRSFFKALISAKLFLLYLVHSSTNKQKNLSFLCPELKAGGASVDVEDTDKYIG